MSTGARGWILWGAEVPLMFRRVSCPQVQEAGFCGVQNFPTVGLIDGVFRQNLEETGMGFGLEVEMIRKAAAMGLLTTPYAFDAEQVCCTFSRTSIIPNLLNMLQILLIILVILVLKMLTRLPLLLIVLILLITLVLNLLLILLIGVYS
jgi:hypothetical protein